MEHATIQRTGSEPKPLVLDELDQKFKPGFYRQMEAFLARAASPTQDILAGYAPCYLPEAVKTMRVLDCLAAS